MSLDAAVERAGRWLAGRQSRRSFLGRLGRAAVLVGSGPTIATLLVDRAEARVCGQTGVSPKCPTFDCLYADSVWGWCWYASDGCCRNGGLKKICDCCTRDWPNVHGYCPTGTNVRCIVESCGTDPRVQTTTLTRLQPGRSGYADTVRSLRFPAAATAVLADAESRLAAAVAAPIAGTLGVPFVRMSRRGLSQARRDALRAIGVRDVILAGPALVQHAGSLQRDFGVEVVGSAPDPGRFSQDVAAWIRSVNRIGRTVTVTPEGLSGDAAAAAALFAACQGFPLVVGPDAAEQIGLPTLLVGPELTGFHRTLSVATERTKASGYQALVRELAELAYANPVVDRGRAAIVPDGADLLDLVDLNVPALVHPAWSIGGVLDWVFAHQRVHGPFGEVYLGLGNGQIGDEDVWRLQSALNGFEVHQLMGVAGQGLPVFSQPLPEREVGKARVDGRPTYPDQAPPAYWTSRAQTLR